MGEGREKLVLGEPLMWNINVRKLMECHSDTPFFVQELRRSANDSRYSNVFIEHNRNKYNNLF